MGKYKVGGAYLEFGCTPEYGVENSKGYQVAIASSYSMATKIARALNNIDNIPTMPIGLTWKDDVDKLNAQV